MLLKTTYKEMLDIVLAAGDTNHPKYASLVVELNRNVRESGIHTHVPYESELFDIIDEVTE